MHVSPEPALLLCNAEVLHLLTAVSARSSGTRGRQAKSNAATILYETLKYLEETPAASVPDDAAVRQLLLQLKQFKLTKSEKLEIVNHLPTSLVELQLVVEESEERFTEDQMNELLNIVTAFVESFMSSEEVEDMETSVVTQASESAV